MSGPAVEPVAIVGTGNVGRALGERVLAANVELHFGAREPIEKSRALSGPLAGVPVLTITEAVTRAKIILLAVPAAAVVDVVRAMPDLTGKVLVDCTNPLRWDNGPVWTPPSEGSVTQALAAAFPQVAVVKGFNHFGAEIQRNPALVGGAADAFFAGDRADAKTKVMSLAKDMGFRPHDAGPLRNAALLENLAVLWIHVATVGGAGRNFGFRMEVQA